MPDVSAEAHRDAARAARERLILAGADALDNDFDAPVLGPERDAAVLLDAFLSRPDDLVAVMGMEQAAGQEWWCPEARRISRWPTCLLPDTDPDSHQEVDVFVRRRTQGGTE